MERILRAMARLLLLVVLVVGGVVAAQYLLGPAAAPHTVGSATQAATASLSATPAVSPSAVAGVPDACRPYVRGVAFATGTLIDRVNAANRWGDQHPGDQISLILTDAAMQDLADHTQWTVPVDNVRVSIDTAGVRLSATAVLFGRFTIKALLAPEVTAGRLRMTTRELDTDGLPGFLRPTVEDALASAADVNAWGLRMRVDGATTQQGCGVVWGRG
jgi:hypothetical protein